MRQFKSFLESNDLIYYSLLILALFPILPYGILTGATMLFLIVISLNHILLYRNKKNVSKKKIIHFITLGGFYFFILCSLVYSNNFIVGYKIILRTIPLLLFPAAFFFSGNYRLTNQKRNNLIKIFIFSAFALLVYVFYLGILSMDDFHSHSVRNRLTNTNFLDLHSTYLSLYFLAAIFFLVFSFKKTHTRILVIFLFFMGLLLIFSRVAMLSLLFQSVFMYFLLGEKSFFSKTLIILIGFVAIGIIINMTPFLKYRITEVFQYGLQPTENNKRLSSTSMRLAVYNCAYDVSKKNILFGVGIGDLQEELRECYLAMNSPTFYEKDLNTHNFYFYMLGATGIFGLVSFFLAIIFLMYTSFLKKSWPFFLIFSLLFITLFTENILVRSYGITYYCFFLAIFLFSKNQFKH